MASCPFCKRDPYHYVDVGVSYVPVAVNCCDMGIALFGKDEVASKRAWKILQLMRSHSPRRKARAQRLLNEGYALS